MKICAVLHHLCIKHFMIVLTRDLARQLTAPIGLACPHQPRLPPSASLAPVGLACPHGEEDGSALVLGIGLRLWQSALGFPSLSSIYKVHSFPSLCIDRQFIFFSIIFSCQQIEPKLVDLIGREIVDSHCNAWGNKVDTSSQPKRMLRGDCILMIPTSIYV